MSQSQIVLAIAVSCYPTSGSSGNTSIRVVRKFETKPIYGSFDGVDDLPKAPRDLRYAFVMFRHGIRSPIYIQFQTRDQYATMWPDGMGELTANGKRLMFNVGRSLRRRYQQLVPRFDPEVVQFTSTGSSRATMSTYCVAAGLFPVEDPVFKEKEGLSTWQPILVVNNVTYDKHKLFSGKKEKSQCKRFTAMREQVKGLEKSQAPDMRKAYYEELNSCISKAYHKSNFADTFQGNSKAYDTFQAWILNDKDVPRWVAHMFPVVEKMKQMRMWVHIHRKPNMVRYFTGPLFKMIQNEMDEMEATVWGTDRRLKMHIHGSHDITMCATLWATNGDETYLALPGDIILIEMTADSEVKMYLYVPLGVEKSDRFKPISLEPLCGKVGCCLAKFKEALKDLSFDEVKWKRLCNDDSPLDNNFRTFPHDIDQNDLDIMKEAKAILNGIFI